jgi:hypothetical protein
MRKNLETLIAKSRSVSLSPSQKERQRQSFAYGNAKIENERVTRDTIAKEAQALKAKPK